MSRRDLTLHLGLVAVLFLLHFILPAYHHGVLARIMVMAVYAIGYNIAFGYTGLLSLGHAMFFGAGLYGMGLAGLHYGVPAFPAFLIGTACGAALAFVVGLLALRTEGVSFMIVTLMFSQVAYLALLYFGAFTHGDDGFVVPDASRTLMGLSLSDEGTRYLVAWVLFSGALLGSLWLIRQPFGRVLIALRENEERARLLGYDTKRRKLAALVISGAVSAASGAAYAALFGYVGATFAGVQYSIFALLWVLLGGAGTVLGPFVGTLFMFYLIDLATGLTDAYMLIAGVALVGLTLFAPQGIVGELRRRFWKDLP
ncbi:branched-chain amino acid ABC transporter permease [Pseudooceanicola sp. CBS1P-1]|uniref:Branched-chain amino acid ABC transporter permease n=1 Tax=Pseudooceanicola albus TaxID=2692189 RepID=A0A6L7G6Y4_9RHOB|nr:MULTISPECIES: branched-chain amino acid ABC transporter permease [Pseudooceanicola]MBT9383100.1 branched-chain amino acid ABC transporter permease [Pseudooceanicola endophyticus]MXN19288.1 branched-chain amino acid ABC transporter permease [Pseudooceanicola albus]